MAKCKKVHGDSSANVIKLLRHNLRHYRRLYEDFVRLRRRGVNYAVKSLITSATPRRNLRS